MPCPSLGQCLDGNLNGHTAIRQQCDWLLREGFLRPGSLMISDRGTFSVEHVARLHRHDCHVLCSVPWGDYRELYDAQAGQPGLAAGQLPVGGATAAA